MKTINPARPKAAKTKSASKSIEAANPEPDGMSSGALDEPSLADHPAASEKIQTAPELSNQPGELTHGEPTVAEENPPFADHPAALQENETPLELPNQPGDLTDGMPTVSPDNSPLSVPPPVVEEIRTAPELFNQPANFTDGERTVVPDGTSWADHPDVLEEIQTARELFSQLNQLAEQDALARIKNHFGRFVALSLKTDRSALQASINAWLCGTLLNRAKKQKGHKAFGAWRDEHLVPAVMCERTTQRHMKLANKYQTLDELIAAGGARTGRTNEEGNNEPEDKSTPPASGGKTKASALLSSIRGLHKILRLFTESDEKLDDGELDELRLMKPQFDALFQKVVGDMPEPEVEP